AAASGGALPQAWSKVQQARAQLNRGDLEGAERLAREAAALGVEFTPREDTPAKVLEDVLQTRRDPKKLLAASRAALKTGALDRAEQLALAADKTSSTFTFPVWGDTPGKVRKDIQTARARETAQLLERRAGGPDPDKKASGGVLQSVKGFFGGKGKEEQPPQGHPEEHVAQAPKAPGADGRDSYTAQKFEAPAGEKDAGPAGNTANTEAARQLLAQGRKALAQGKFELASKCAADADACK